MSENVKVVAQNRKARHEYFILERYEAGLVLTGTEIKSIHQGKVNLAEAYIRITSGEAFILGMHIGFYEQGNQFNHVETRTRKLLLNKREIRKLQKATQLEGHTIVPLRLYLKRGLAKIEIAEAKGKKLYDKRQSQKERDVKRQLQKATRK